MHCYGDVLRREDAHVFRRALEFEDEGEREGVGDITRLVEGEDMEVGLCGDDDDDAVCRWGWSDRCHWVCGESGQLRLLVLTLHLSSSPTIAPIAAREAVALTAANNGSSGGKEHLILIPCSGPPCPEHRAENGVLLALFTWTLPVPVPGRRSSRSGRAG